MATLSEDVSLIDCTKQHKIKLSCIILPLHNKIVLNERAFGDNLGT